MKIKKLFIVIIDGAWSGDPHDADIYRLTDAALDEPMWQPIIRVGHARGIEDVMAGKINR
jgi:hypothetical protein